MIVAGTSATVTPAAYFPMQVRDRGGTLIEVNLYRERDYAFCTVSLRGIGRDIGPPGTTVRTRCTLPGHKQRPNSIGRFLRQITAFFQAQYPHRDRKVEQRVLTPPLAPSTPWPNAV